MTVSSWRSTQRFPNYVWQRNWLLFLRLFYKWDRLPEFRIRRKIRTRFRQKCSYFCDNLDSFSMRLELTRTWACMQCMGAVKINVVRCTLNVCKCDGKEGSITKWAIACLRQLDAIYTMRLSCREDMRGSKGRGGDGRDMESWPFDLFSCRHRVLYIK